jgi:hypothetical protein
VHAVFGHPVGVGLTSVASECLSAATPTQRFYEALDGQVAGEPRLAEAGTRRPSVLSGCDAEDMTWLLLDADCFRSGRWDRARPRRRARLRTRNIVRP